MEDLHIVIQVFRMAQPMANENEPQKNDPPKNNLGSKIKRTLRSESVKRKQRDREKTDTSQMMLSTSLGEIGVQHLTPLCFSVTPAFSTSAARQKQERSPLFSFPDAPESQTDFVKRLLLLAHPSSPAAETNPIVPIAGASVDLFTSHLGGDLTRALLDEPPQLAQDAPEDAAPLGPQLLADVAGDRAISYDGLSPENNIGVRVQDPRRSRADLRRLPGHGGPSTTTARRSSSSSSSRHPRTTTVEPTWCLHGANASRGV